MMSTSNKTTLEPIVYPIAFAGVTALAKGLKITQIVAAAVVDWDDVVDRKILLGVAALTLVIVAIEDIVANSIRKFATWSFVGFHGKSKLICIIGVKATVGMGMGDGID